MPIDNCTSDFRKLANSILPAHMESMRKSIADPFPMADFLVKGRGTKTLLKEHGFAEDFSGCYVFIEKRKPVYVGISRKLFTRLWYHSRGTQHYTATLAYSIAAHGFVSPLKRNQRMMDESFLQHFELAKARIRKFKAAYVPIENPLELYLF